MRVANRENLKEYAKTILDKNYTKDNERQLINICTKRNKIEGHPVNEHGSFAVVRLLQKIGKLIGTYGVESIDMEQSLGKRLSSDEKYAYYCNAGDVYLATIMFYRGKFRIGSIAELFE